MKEYTFIRFGQGSWHLVSSRKDNLGVRLKVEEIEVENERFFAVLLNIYFGDWTAKEEVRLLREYLKEKAYPFIVNIFNGHEVTTAIVHANNLVGWNK